MFRPGRVRVQLKLAVLCASCILAGAVASANGNQDAVSGAGGFSCTYSGAADSAGYVVVARSAAGSVAQATCTVDGSAGSPIQITWAAGQTFTPAAYEVYRTKGSGGAGTIARLDASTHGFYDQGQKPLDSNPPPAVVIAHAQQAEKDVEYAYAVVATLKTKETYLYPAGATVRGGPFDGSSSNEIRWEPRPDAVSYTVYRMRGGEEGAIGSITGSTVLLDTGQAADGKLPAPNRPEVTPSSTTSGALMTYSYVVVARTATSDTPASPQGDTRKGPPKLSDDDYNTVTWDPVPGALSYDIYRTKGGDSQGKIQTVSDLGHLSVEDRGAKVIGSLDALSAANGDSTVPPMSTADTRFVVGGELGALSGKAEQANLLLDVMLTGPLKSGKHPLGAWLDGRLASAPAAASSITVGTVIDGSNAATLVTKAQGMTLDQIVAGLRMQFGVEYSLHNPLRYPDSREYAVEPELIGGAGFTTPVAGHDETPQIFMYDPVQLAARGDRQNQCAASDDDSGPRDAPCTYIAFVAPDRHRFYGQWFLGLRLKTHHYHLADDPTVDATARHMIDAAFPGIIDLTLGQDQAVTEGKFEGLVFHVNAFYPLPVESGASAFYLFGALDARLGSATGFGPLYLTDAPSGVKITDPAVLRQPVLIDRDDWRIGIGLDLSTLIHGLRGHKLPSGQ